MELLQDMLVGAFNDAATKAQEMAASKMSVITGGMKHPRVDVGRQIKC